MKVTLRVKKPKGANAFMKHRMAKMLGVATVNSDPCNCCNCEGRRWFCMKSPNLSMSREIITSCCQKAIPRTLTFTITCEDCGCLNGHSGTLNYIGDLPQGSTWAGNVACTCIDESTEAVYFSMYCDSSSDSTWFYNATGCADKIKGDFQLTECNPLYFMATDVETDGCCGEPGTLTIEVTE